MVLICFLTYLKFDIIFWLIFPYFFKIKYGSSNKDSSMKVDYAVDGTGEAVVFIHGLSDSLNYWQFLTENLKKDFQIIRFNLRGHGGSELGNDEITMDTYINDLNNILIELKIKKANLVGFSLGGAVALGFTIKYPDKVSSMVMMSSFFKCNSHLEDVFSEFEDALDGGFGEFFDMILPKVLCPEVIQGKSEELQILKEISSKNNSVSAIRKAIEAGSQFNVENRLSEINVPTLIVAGKYDGLCLLSMQEEVHEKIKGSELIVFDNVEHNLLVGENNQKILEILQDFLSKKRKNK